MTNGHKRNWSWIGPKIYETGKVEYNQLLTKGRVKEGHGPPLGLRFLLEWPQFGRGFFYINNALPPSKQKKNLALPLGIIKKRPIHYFSTFKHMHNGMFIDQFQSHPLLEVGLEFE